jgi:hypothetical protein
MLMMRGGVPTTTISTERAAGPAPPDGARR